jgi:hypothetical protein
MVSSPRSLRVGQTALIAESGVAVLVERPFRDGAICGRTGDESYVGAEGMKGPSHGICRPPSVRQVGPGMQ